MGKKNSFSFGIGLVLFIIGIVIVLQHVVVNSFSVFYRIGRVNVGGILLLLMMVALIALLTKPNKITKMAFTGLVALFFVCLILSLDVRMARVSGLEIILMLGTICVGLALMLRSVLKK